MSSLKTLKLSANQIVEFGSTILVSTPVAFLEMEGNPLWESGKFRDLEGYAEYEERRKGRIVARG
jgi:Leucine-rich repeat (LRR) protein